MADLVPTPDGGDVDRVVASRQAAHGGGHGADRGGDGAAQPQAQDHRQNHADQATEQQGQVDRAKALGLDLLANRQPRPLGIGQSLDNGAGLGQAPGCRQTGHGLSLGVRVAGRRDLRVFLSADLGAGVLEGVQGRLFIRIEPEGRQGVQRRVEHVSLFADCLDEALIARRNKAADGVLLLDQGVQRGRFGGQLGVALVIFTTGALHVAEADEHSDAHDQQDGHHPGEAEGEFPGDA